MKRFTSSKTISNVDFKSIVTVSDGKIIFTTSVENNNYFSNKNTSVYIGLYFKTILLDSFIMSENVSCKFYNSLGKSNKKEYSLQKNLDTKNILIDDVIKDPINFSDFKEIKQIDSDIIQELSRKNNSIIIFDPSYIKFLKDKRQETISLLKDTIKNEIIVKELTLKIQHQII